MPVVKMRLKQHPPRASGWKQNSATQDNKTQLILTVKWALFVLIEECAEAYSQKQQGHQQCGRNTLQNKYLQTAHHLPYFQLGKAASEWKSDYARTHPFGSSPLGVKSVQDIVTVAPKRYMNDLSFQHHLSGREIMYLLRNT